MNLVTCPQLHQVIASFLCWHLPQAASLSPQTTPPRSGTRPSFTYHSLTTFPFLPLPFFSLLRYNTLWSISCVVS
ncbi:hypothetical protein GGR50DRAFT_596490 [Xylaria sp. CBS 124048]|nr:hypothetical protein GGR50DRAFT_596490 [Xylaria sp. CBS 124048]